VTLVALLPVMLATVNVPIRLALVNSFRLFTLNG